MSANDLGTFCFSGQSRKEQNVPISSRGFILLPVVVAITLLAAMAFMLSYQGASQTDIAAGELEHDRLRYIAEAGMAHAKVQLAQNTSCSGYSDIPKTDFAGDSYSVDFADQEGSPVEIKAIGELQGGAKFKLVNDSVRAYQTPTTAVLQLSKTGGKDTILDDGYPIRNYGGSSYLRVSSAGWQTRPLLEFDLSSIPSSAKILSASLELWQLSINNSGAVAAHRMTRDWLEGTRNGGGIADGATWETHDGIAAWAQPGGEFDSTVYGVTQVSSADSGGWVAWDIGGLVQNWVSGTVPNYGLLMAGDGNVTNANYASKDTNNPDQAPKLTIVYTCECGEVCAGSSGKLLMVVADAGSPSTGESDRKSLIESWGYEVTLISDHALQAEFDAALANVDVAYITGSGSPADVNTKLTAATVGVLSEDIGLVDELGIAEPAFLKRSSQSINVIDNTHYVTDGFGLGTLQLYTYVPQIWTVTGALAPGLQVLGETQDGGSSYPTGLAVLDTGAELWGGGSAAGRRVQVAWSEGSFDINALNADGQTIFQRAIEWAMGADTTADAGNVLLVVGSASNPATKDQDRKTLFESWGYTVTLIDDGAGQTEFDTEAAANDVIYVTASIGGGALADKLTNSSTPIVNEFAGKLDNFGFSSSTTYTFSADSFNNSDATHYVSSPFSGTAINALTTFLNMPIPGGTLAPGLEFPASFTGFERGIVTLDVGATRWDGDPSPARRVQLPFGPAEVAQLTEDGETLIKRAIEWGAGAGSSQQEILLVVADATNLSAQDIARQTLMADWGYQVETISANDSQANFDAAVATASAAYVVMQNSSTALGTKLRDATIAVINEEVELRAEIGFAANRDWPTTRDNVDIIVDSHYITSPFSPGLLTIATAPIEVVTLSGQMAGGLLVLGQQDWGGLQNSLSVIDTGGALYGGGNAAGRRVQLPWGRVGFDINDLNADGLTIMQRAIEWGIAGGGGGGGGGGSGTTVTLLPTQDTFVGGNSTAVYGGNVSLFMGFGSREWRPVLQFDVSGIPAGSTVTSAKLRLHNWDDGSASAGPLTVTAYRVQQAWTATWGNKGANWYDRAKQGGGALQWSTPGVSYSTGDSAIATFDSTAAPQWVEWEVAPLVQGWIDGASTNNGIVLVPDAGSAWANSRSADYGDAALHPQLVVTYE